MLSRSQSQSFGTVNRMTLTVFFHAGGLTVMRDFCQLKNKQVMQFVNQDLGTRSGLSLPISCSIEECSFVI